MGCVLRARTQMQDRKDFRPGVDRQPQPQDAAVAAESGAQFVQLDVRDLQGVEAVLVQALSVLASTSEPPRDGRLTGAENPRGRRSIQPFGKPPRAPWRPGEMEF